MKTKKINNEIKIQIPDEYDVIVNPNGSFRIKKIQFPESWKEIGQMEGFYLKFDSMLSEKVSEVSMFTNKNIYPTRELAKAGRSLTQLVYLKELYNNGWKPDWSDDTKKYVIEVLLNKLSTNIHTKTSFPMAFKTQKIRDLFLKNFRDLLEIAKPLL